jgi:hypothetical protein
MLHLPARPIKEGWGERIDEIVCRYAERVNFLERPPTVWLGVDPCGRHPLCRAFSRIFVSSFFLVIVPICLRLGDSFSHPSTPEEDLARISVLGDVHAFCRCNSIPSSTDLGLEIRNEDVVHDFMTQRTGEDGVDVVLVDRALIVHVGVVEDRLDADVWYIIKLGNWGVPMIRPSEAIGLLHLRAEVTEEEDGGIICPEEQ